MISVVQRVSSAAVTVESEGYRAAIASGLLVLLGVAQGDTTGDAEWMAGKLARLRVFRDDDDKMNRSVQDIGGEILLISQFTLLGDSAKGNRPSFVRAATPQVGAALYESVGEMLEGDYRVPLKRGIFGASMKVELVNDGPVTLILDSRSKSPA